MHDRNSFMAMLLFHHFLSHEDGTTATLPQVSGFAVAVLQRLSEM